MRVTLPDPFPLPHRQVPASWPHHALLISKNKLVGIYALKMLLGMICDYAIICAVEYHPMRTPKLSIYLATTHPKIPLILSPNIFTKLSARGFPPGQKNIYLLIKYIPWEVFSMYSNKRCRNIQTGRFIPQK